ncbi:bifunctional histidinol-phosphatase/imidazoleglycerol-phosphate dehydratase HisB [Legionella jordanis]|uniref:Histidine biosynthesis bifunctional protein HisB n=1 Tax=Legionella jordanis TaxID=456 RepID=A0A0W0VA03_9GAMM|nr:bifunctional histidinol-phosphatase/imidazoleglycerol-phosphate dehydratase HisB [Legionella jordanis]KTD16971.1 imidazole glycerol-phosphate dehydratase/histidinol phosphatase [Legionella jordanis]RMX03112.1 bifunctional histidinol-phosphatase/imidazoleglycerol-phosphate dehydratase HisB [Legionella jordanis]VEH12835.1 histidinol-phosphatase [Legionella jordanis]
MKKVLFIDRDGTLVEEPQDFQVDRLEKIRLCKDVIPSLLSLQKAGFQLIMVSNQDGLGSESFPQADFELCQKFILNLFNSQGVHFDHIFICPHKEMDGCSCRKPKIGLLLNYIRDNQFNCNQSWVIGDRESDRQLADNLGVGFFPINPTHGWKNITSSLLKRPRSAKVIRRTKETALELTLTLDDEHDSTIETPIGFFNHMLEQVAKHGGFCLEIKAQGDVEVDDHHLIEDSALALGEALKQALNDKKGIARYGFTLPMDESQASIIIDLSGRSYCKFDGQFSREFVGGLATEMIPHFFHSFANALGATIHVQVKGENHHHMIEACFKALGRVLRQACSQTGTDLPSTKGVL